MINIPTNNAISILFVFFAITPAERALITPDMPSDIILGKIKERRSVPGNALIKFSMNLCFESIFPTNNPPNLKE